MSNFSRGFIDFCTYWPTRNVNEYTAVDHLPSGNIKDVGIVYACKWDEGTGEKITVNGNEYTAKTKVTLDARLSIGGWLAEGQHFTDISLLDTTLVFPIVGVKRVQSLRRNRYYNGYYL